MIVQIDGWFAALTRILPRSVHMMGVMPRPQAVVPLTLLTRGAGGRSAPAPARPAPDIPATTDTKRDRRFYITLEICILDVIE